MIQKLILNFLYGLPLVYQSPHLFLLFPNSVNISPDIGPVETEGATRFPLLRDIHKTAALDLVIPIGRNREKVGTYGVPVENE